MHVLENHYKGQSTVLIKDRILMDGLDFTMKDAPMALARRGVDDETWQQVVDLHSGESSEEQMRAFLDHPDLKVQQALAKHGGDELRFELVRSSDPLVRAEVARFGGSDIQKLLANDPSVDVLKALAQYGPDDIRWGMIGHESDEVRRAVIEHGSDEMRWELVHDENPENRAYLAKVGGTEIRESMVNDPEEVVQAAIAKARMIGPMDEEFVFESYSPDAVADNDAIVAETPRASTEFQGPPTQQDMQEIKESEELQRDRLLQSWYEENKSIAPSLDDMEEVESTPEDLEFLNTWLNENGFANEIPGAVNDESYDPDESNYNEDALVEEYHDIETVKSQKEGVRELVFDHALQGLISELGHCDADVVSIMTDGQGREVTALRLPDTSHEHYESIVKQAQLNSTDLGEARLTKDDMIVVDGSRRAALMPKDARFRFQNPLGNEADSENSQEQSAEANDNPVQEESDPENDGVLRHLQQHLAQLMELRGKEASTPDQNGGDGFTLIGGKRKSSPLDPEISKISDQIIDHYGKVQPPLVQAIKERSNLLCSNKRIASLVGAGALGLTAQKLGRKDAELLQSLAMGKSNVASFINDIADQARRVKVDLDDIKQATGAKAGNIGKMTDNLRDKLAGPDGLLKKAMMLDVLNQQGVLQKFLGQESAIGIVESLKESLDSVRHHPLASKLSIEGLKLSELPGLQSLNRAIQEMGEGLSRAFDGVKNIFSPGRGKN